MIYFIYGDNTPLQIKYQELSNQIKSNNPKIVEKFFDLSQKEDEEKFYQCISTNSIFSPKEFIVVKRTEEFNLKKLNEFIKGISNYNISQKEIIILYEEFLDEFGRISNELTKAQLDNISTISTLICYRKENEKKATLLFIQQDLNISPGEANALIELIGEDYFTIINECEKIKNFLDGERFSIEKVKPILSINKDYNLRQLLDNFIKNKSYKDLIEHLQKENMYMSFIYLLADELIILLKFNSLLESGTLSVGMNRFNFESKYPNIKKFFQRRKGFFDHYFFVYSKFNKMTRFKSEFLIKKLKDILFVEYNVKSGNMNEDIAVCNYILNFFN